MRAENTQEEIMHPVIMQHFAAEHIREIHAKAEDERLARQARQGRRARRAWRAW